MPRSCVKWGERRSRVGLQEEEAKLAESLDEQQHLLQQSEQQYKRTLDRVKDQKSGMQDESSAQVQNPPLLQLLPLLSSLRPPLSPLALFSLLPPSSSSPDSALFSPPSNSSRELTLWPNRTRWHSPLDWAVFC